MNFLDLHDDILLAIQGHLDLRTRFQVSSLSRRLRYVALPHLWETLVLNLSDDEGPRRAHINAMEWMVAGSTTDVGFKLKFVKEVYFRWGDLYGISDPDDDWELSEEEEAYREELQEFFGLLVRILTGPPPIISLHFHGVFEYGQSPFVLDLFSRLWGPITALPNLRSLDLPKLFTPASLSEFTGIITSWDPPPPSSTLTRLDYGYGVYYEHEHFGLFENDLRIIRHLPNLQSLRIQTIRHGTSLGVSHWCTDVFWKSVRRLEFDGDMPVDWEDLLSSLEGYTSRGNHLRLEALVFSGEFFLPASSSRSRRHVRRTAEAFACDALKELQIGFLKFGKHAMEELFSLINESFPRLERLSLRAEFTDWQRQASRRRGRLNIAPMISQYRHLQALRLDTFDHFSPPFSSAPKNDDEKRANPHDAVRRYGLDEAFVTCPTLTKLRIGYRHWLLREGGDERADEKDEDPKPKLNFLVSDLELWEEVFEFRLVEFKL